MKTIHKVSCELGSLQDWTEFTMPKDAKVLSVGNQGESLCIWYETDPDTKPKSEPHWFRVAGTGHPLDEEGYPNRGRFLGTVQFMGGKLIFHIYEEKR